MKRVGVVSALLGLGFAISCGGEDTPPSTGTSAAAGTGTGGSSGTSTAGAPTGGTTTGGTTTGGTTTGGTTTGGAIGAGTAGTLTGGSAGTATGGMAGTATGGAAGSTAGTATGGGGTGGGGGLTLQQLVGKLDGRLITMPCNDQPKTDDCNSKGFSLNGGAFVGCTNNQLNVVQEYEIGGTPGATYMVTMHFYGIMEPKQYGMNANRESQARPNNVDTGATPVPWYVDQPGTDYQQTTYNTYEIHVLNNMMQEVGTYYLNSDTQEGHFTYVINYEKTIPIIGGGRVRMRTFDSNCRQIKNCGATAGYPCANKARTVNIAAADPQPAANTLQQPSLGVSNDHAGQWFLVDVVRFTGP